jgi:hypothetical protein
MPAAAVRPVASQPTTPPDALTDVLVTPSARNLAAALPHQLNTARNLEAALLRRRACPAFTHPQSLPGT